MDPTLALVTVLLRKSWLGTLLEHSAIHGLGIPEPSRSTGERKGGELLAGDLRELLPWPPGTFDVKCGDHPPPHPLPFSARLLDDVMGVLCADWLPAGRSRL